MVFIKWTSEVVACGAAIQTGVLSGEVGNIVLVDVTPLTLGVETLGGVATSLIARNTPIPVKRAEMLTAAADMQTAVPIHVFQGERPFAADNTSLSEFDLEGLAPAPRGVPKIEVTFDIDANGILDVSARDPATGRSQSIRITGSTRLAGKGLPNLQSRGHGSLYVRVNVRVPEKLSPEERKLFERLRAIRSKDK